MALQLVEVQAIWPQIAWCLVLHYVLQESDCADRSHVVATKHRDSRFRLTLAEAMLPMMMMIRIRMDFVGRLYRARPFRVQV